MEKTYTVGRSANADLRIPKHHDAVGKLHAELTDLGKGRVRLADLQSTNGTFVRVSGRWREIKAALVLDLDAEIMLGDFRTTPRDLLAMRAPSAEPKKPESSRRLRRNEFGEIIPE